MWKLFRCRPFRHHDFQPRRVPGALFLECSRCGRRSRGWNLADGRLKRTDVRLRLFIAESGEALREVPSTTPAPPEMLAASVDAAELRLTFGRDS